MTGRDTLTAGLRAEQSEPSMCSGYLLSGGILLATVVSGSVAAYAHSGHGIGRAPKPTSDELAAFAEAKPAFERHCFRCHTTASKKSKRKALDHVSMDQYPFGGHHADEAGRVVRKVLGAEPGGKATMPSDDPGSVKGDDLAKILGWADSFDRAHPASAEAASKSDREPHAH